MPRWIYTRPPEHCHPTELVVARKLNQLPDTWIVRWGFYYVSSGTTREGDFLVFGPDGGLLVLEVKTVLRLFSATGRWEGEENSDNPKFQMDAEWKGVLNALQEQCRSESIPFVAKAICVPGECIDDSLFSYLGIPRAEIFDQRDLSRFTSRWSEIFRGHIRVPAQEAKAAFMATFGAELREIRHFVKETDALLLRQLSLDYEVLDMLVDNEQLLVSGGVGSGKTWMALEHANRLAAAGNKVLFLCYNLHLASLLKQMVDKRPALPGSVCVMAWEELAQDILEKAGIPWAPPLDDGGKIKAQFYTEEVPFLLCELLDSKAIHPEFDALVVDEAQDHDTQFCSKVGNLEPGGWWRIYRALLKRGDQAPMGVYYDPAQRPYFRADAFSDKELFEWAPHAAKVRLLKTVRYTRQLMRFLQGMKSPVSEALVAGLHEGELIREGPDVEIHVSDTAHTPLIVAQIISKWVSDGFCKPSEILILSRHGNPLTRGALEGRQKLGSWTIAITGTEADISVSSFHKAKGLDSLGVIMIDTDPFDQIDEVDQIGYWMAASRARQLLAIVHQTLT